ncbi:thiopurine S-methyltransferase [Pseudomonas silvicola]|nr:thiopurine S-methyltransferase [Pseudomonas silvicola]
MQADFWQERWHHNQIGFHQAAVNPYLQAHWPGLGLASGVGVLVPLCGKSLDLAWLAGQGMRVVGVELAQKAVEAFFSEHGLEPEVQTRGAFRCYQAGDVQLWCGDFFALTAADVASCTALYDRAALIALPPSMRERYVRHLADILPHARAGLLVTLEYDQSLLPGPPFAVAEEEARALYGRDWTVQQVECRDVLAESPKQRNAGADYLNERVYQLSR